MAKSRRKIQRHPDCRNETAVRSYRVHIGCGGKHIWTTGVVDAEFWYILQVIGSQALKVKCECVNGTKLEFFFFGSK